MNNGEILFLYDAELTNPNGDPDDENRPRMDYQSRRNLVSDVRLKRYIRDYLQSLGRKIFVESREDGQVVDAGTRIKNVLGHLVSQSDVPELTNRLDDIRLFGATIPIKKNKEENISGDSIKITGPVQFTWGYSLNHADLVDTYSITSRFASGENKTQGTIGKDYRIYYSLIGFYGVLSGHRAERTNMTDADCDLLDKAIIQSIPQQATRSKIGQFPRLYIRFKYKNKETAIGDWRNYVLIKQKNNLRNIEDVQVDLELLVSKISESRDKIEEIYLWLHPLLKLERSGNAITHKDFKESLPVKIKLLDF